jgi:hypothetical protein
MMGLMTIEHTRKCLSEWLLEPYAWRTHVVDDYPDRESFEGLKAVAAYVAGLPDDDSNLIEIDRIWGERKSDAFSLPTGMPPLLTERVDLYRLADPSKWLADFAKAYVIAALADPEWSA